MSNSKLVRISRWLDDRLSSAYMPRIFSAFNLSERMPKVDLAWDKVRNELAEVGLLYDADEEGDGYLDQIELIVSPMPSFGASGFVFDEGVDVFHKVVGFREGCIYLLCDMPHTAYSPGETLTDVIRHEYAHSWYWLEPDFVDGPWFRKAFGASYVSQVSPVEAWLKRSGLSIEPSSPNWDKQFRNEFVSDYAATKSFEDFAECFMYYLRYRKSLDRFKKRTGVYRKLKLIESAVKRARRELGI